MARPRTNPIGTTATDRARQSLERRLAAGDKRVVAYLSAEAAAALERIRRPGETTTALVERLVLAAAD